MAMFALTPTALSLSDAMKSHKGADHSTPDSALKFLLTFNEKALYEQHRIHRRVDCHRGRHPVLFWFALKNRLVSLL